MNLLITGCCGHIGSYVAENIYKIKKIKKTILVDNIKSNRFCSLYNLKKYTRSERIKIGKGHGKLCKFFSDQKLNVIFPRKLMMKSLKK